MTKFVAPRFPRTLGDYLNPLAAAGLHVTAIAEPVPPDELVAARPAFARCRDIAAFLLMVKATHP